MGDEEAPAWSFLMPFVSVASRGGPHDDESYTCGFEMGMLHALLGSVRPSSIAQSIHTTNLQQADLLAMSHGYTLKHTESSIEGWTDIVLEPTGDSI